ncbi:hypothetical protein RhiirC2_784484 [Rhizophagus irregularis]|uniref:Uncharacterized protein n=1 Tax=Rhizophagus irregularis TaxID=588596 RepID=A0A2N1MYE2_9GLOM|nr:hypothetical protein RhiirC2_784484 [Rhizophagus irregularis]
MGFVYNRYQKGMYVNRYERPDVIEYRKQFLEEISMYQNLMPIFEGNNLNQGHSIHISNFLTNTIGRLKLNDDQIEEVGDSMHYENIDKLIEQIENWAILIFKKTHSGAIAIFVFDNSSSYRKYAGDALNANHMNLNPNNYHDRNLCGKPKGMKIILEKRGLWPSKELKAYCGNNEYNVNFQCCARHILSNQLNFLNTKLLIQEIIEAKGHKTELQRVVPLALDSVPINHIRKYARKFARYMDCYRKGLNAKQAESKQAEYTVKKFKSYRTIPNSILEDIDFLCN